MSIYMRAKRLLNLVGDRLYTLPMVILYLTDGCNSRCAMCDIWKNPRQDMSLELVEDIATSLAELDVRVVMLSGGEAMQHPQWPQIARRLSQEGADIVQMLTNGLLLRKQLSEVVSNVHQLIVSLDGGTRETYKAIRGVDALDLVLEGIRAAADAGIPVITRTTIQRTNYQELPEIIRKAKAAGAEKISFLTVDVSANIAFGNRLDENESVRLPLSTTVPTTPVECHPLTDALTPDDIPRFAAVLESIEKEFAEEFACGLIVEPPEKLRRMVTFFQAINGMAEFEPPRCNAPQVSVVIEVDGTLRPCYFLPSWGKIDGKSLRKAINEVGARALRTAFRTGKRPECKCCVCPIHMSRRFLLKL